jgi:branched-chain amino acid transport system permease protein
MGAFITYTVIGLVTGAGFAIAASGFVLTYTTSRIFNIAHGAIALAGAAVYYDLAFEHGWPRLLALLVVVLVFAPLLGLIIDWGFRTFLSEAPVNITLIVTVAVFVILYGAVSKALPQDLKPITPLMQSVSIRIHGVKIDGNALLMLILAVAIAIGFYLFFKFTRTGTAMRAVVDNRSLLALHGARPGLMSALSWIIGCGLACLAGILLSASSQQGLYPFINLTLLVITAYAAAILGQLENLPMTFVGSILLGLGNSYIVAYLPTNAAYSGLKLALPSILLLLVLIVLPRAPLRVGQIKGVVSVPVPSMTRAVACGVGLIAAIAIIATQLSESNALYLSLGFSYAILMLSLIPLTGYGGYLNLAPLAFAGLGALIMADIHRISFHTLQPDSPIAYIIAGVGAGIIGAVLGLLAIRLGTLYIAIATLAFAELVDQLIFSTDVGFKFGGQKVVKRIDLFGLRMDSESRYLVFSAVVFVLLGLGVLALRRGSYGRLLFALRDSPAACGTLGLNLTVTRVAVFALSSAMGGFAGAIYAGQQVSFGEVKFQFFFNLLVVLCAVVGGITSVSGALIGGMALMLINGGPLIHKYFFFGPKSHLQSGGFLIVGVFALLLGRNPNGIASYLFRLGRLAQRVLLPGSGDAQAQPAGSGTGDTRELSGREEVSLGGAV